MPKTIKPGYNHLLIEAVANKSEFLDNSNLINPDDKKLEYLQVGKILAVGLPDNEAMTVNIDVGDHVLYQKAVSHKTRVGGKDFILITYEDVIGVIDEAQGTEIPSER